jgi:MFS family permease
LHDCRPQLLLLLLCSYYLPVGLASLLWGPACDVWGRKATYLASTALYAAAT